MVSQIVGFRIEIERIEGKWKMSQNHPVGRQTKVIAALRGLDHPDSMAVADLMQSRLDQLESPQATT
jgi:transcriptional regulator